jgi:hypothetical protein
MGCWWLKVRLAFWEPYIAHDSRLPAGSGQPPDEVELVAEPLPAVFSPLPYPCPAVAVADPPVRRLRIS